MDVLTATTEEIIEYFQELMDQTYKEDHEIDKNDSCQIEED